MVEVLQVFPVLIAGNVINEGALIAARLGKKAIEHSDMEEARDKVRWGKRA